MQEGLSGFNAPCPDVAKLKKKIKRTNKGEAKPTVRTFAWEWVQTKVSLLRVAPCNDDAALSKYK